MKYQLINKKGIHLVRIINCSSKIEVKLQQGKKKKKKTDLSFPRMCIVNKKNV